jgi:DNA topoisomerase VI subunit A
MMNVTNKVVFDLSCMLGCSRGHLNIVASKDLFIGQMTMVMGTGEEVCGRPCEIELMAISIHLENIKQIIGKSPFFIN